MSCPQGGTLIFSYIRRLGSFLGFKIFNFNIYLFIFYFFLGGGGQKIEYFWGYKDLGIFIGCHHKIGLYLGVVSMHFMAFFKVKVQNGGYFWGC